MAKSVKAYMNGDVVVRNRRKFFKMQHIGSYKNGKVLDLNIFAMSSIFARQERWDDVTMEDQYGR